MPGGICKSSLFVPAFPGRAAEINLSTEVQERHRRNHPLLKQVLEASQSPLPKTKDRPAFIFAPGIVSQPRIGLDREQLALLIKELSAVMLEELSQQPTKGGRAR